MLKPSGSFCQLSEPALESLTESWMSPFSKNAPYKSDLIKSLEDYLRTADIGLLDVHVKSILREFASGF